MKFYGREEELTGIAAIARLVERLRNPSLPRCTILLDAPLIVRTSTAGAQGTHRAI